LVALVQHLRFLAHPQLMQAAEAAEHGILALLVELAGLAEVVMVAKVLARLEVLLQQTLVLAAAVVVKMPLAHQAAQAS
jgi:hypothetical protein